MYVYTCTCTDILPLTPTTTASCTSSLGSYVSHLTINILTLWSKYSRSKEQSAEPVYCVYTYVYIPIHIWRYLHEADMYIHIFSCRHVQKNTRCPGSIHTCTHTHTYPLSPHTRACSTSLYFFFWTFCTSQGVFSSVLDLKKTPWFKARHTTDGVERVYPLMHPQLGGKDPPVT